MPRKHALAVAALLGVAAVAGTLAATRTVSVGASVKPAAAGAQLAQRAKRLEAVEASLARARQDKPPSLPPLRSTPSAGAPAPAAVRFVYRRPAPIQVLASGRSESEHGVEPDDERGGDDD